MDRDPKKYRGSIYINTVESDLNTAQAARKLGFKPLLTPVGDKWILHKIARVIAETSIRSFKRRSGKPLPSAVRKTWETVRKKGASDVYLLRDLDNYFKQSAVQA